MPPYTEQHHSRRRAQHAGHQVEIAPCKTDRVFPFLYRHRHHAVCFQNFNRFSVYLRAEAVIIWHGEKDIAILHGIQGGGKAVRIPVQAPDSVRLALLYQGVFFLHGKLLHGKLFFSLPVRSQFLLRRRNVFFQDPGNLCLMFLRHDQASQHCNSAQFFRHLQIILFRHIGLIQTADRHCVLILAEVKLLFAGGCFLQNDSPFLRLCRYIIFSSKKLPGSIRSLR